MTPKQHYQHDLDTRGYHHDVAQALAMEHLDALYQQLLTKHRHPPGFLTRLFSRRPPNVKGYYLWGGVGRGKTYLMDRFYDALPFNEKQRMHFHSFMHGIHEKLKTLPKMPDPLNLIASQLAQEIRVLCLDEFHVSDIGDAMLLGGFLKAMFKNGVTLVTTSNIPPDELYKNGLQRERFLPAIELIKENCHIFHLDSPTDYRMELLERTGTYHVVNGETAALLEQQFASLAPDKIIAHRTLHINSREIKTVAESDDVVWFSFSEICETARSTADYIELSKQYHTVIISDVPQLSEAKDDAAKRFIHLIDTLYDHNVKTVISAHTNSNELYIGQRHLFAFQRTNSRLQEMASEQYLSKKHLY